MVLLVPNFESNCKASKKLLFPAAFGPNNTDNDSNCTSVSRKDL